MTDLASLGPQFWFGLKHYLPVVAFAAMSWAVGRRLTRSLAYRNEIEAAVLSTILGWGTFGFVFFLLATTGLFTTPWLLVVLAGSQLASYRSWAEAAATVRRRWATRPTRWPARISPKLIASILIAVVLAIGLLPLLALPLYPPTAFDSLMYHLPMAQSIVEQQRIEFFSELRYPVFPALQETLFAAALLLTDDLTPAVLHLVSFLGVAMLAYCWGAWLSSRRAGVLAALVWMGTLAAVRAGMAPYVDCTLALFVTAALFSLHRYIRRRELGWLVASAAFSGFAAGTKYHALFFLGMIALAVLAVTLRHRRWRHLVWYSVVLAALTSPWYLFIYLESGNPVHPFYSQVFGQDEWSYRLPGAPRRSRSTAETPPEGSMASLVKTVGRLGDHLTEKPIETVRLPIDVFLYPWRFPGRPLSPFYVYALALLAAMVWRFRHARYAVLLIVLYFLFLRVTIVDLRYLIPILPLIAVFGAEGADRLLGLVTPSSRQWVAVVLAVALALPLADRAHRIWRQDVGARGTIPTDVDRRDRYLRRHVDLYGVIQKLNQRHEGDYRLYGLFTENLRYYVAGTLLGDWFGPEKYRRVMPSLRDPAALHSVLREMDADYLLVPNLQRWKGRKFRRLRVAPHGKMRSHFQIIHRGKMATVYAPRRHPRLVAPTAEPSARPLDDRSRAKPGTRESD